MKRSEIEANLDPRWADDPPVFAVRRFVGGPEQYVTADRLGKAKLTGRLIAPQYDDDGNRTGLVALDPQPVSFVYNQIAHYAGIASTVIARINNTTIAQQRTNEAIADLAEALDARLLALDGYTEVSRPYSLTARQVVTIRLDREAARALLAILGEPEGSGDLVAAVEDAEARRAAAEAATSVLTDALRERLPVDPIKYDRDGTIEDGHHRAEALDLIEPESTHAPLLASRVLGENADDVSAALDRIDRVR